MRLLALLMTVTLAMPRHVGPPSRALPIAVPNPNTAAAGVLRDGVLEVALDATLAMWHPDGDSLPGIAIEAFAERGSPPRVPGPLLRVPRGTEIHASVRNTLDRDSLTFFLPTAGRTDSLVLAPGETRELRVRGTASGTFIYRATTSAPLARALRVGGLLVGALVVDSSGSSAPTRDRIFVLTSATDAVDPLIGAPLTTRTVRAINGRAWPHTEPLRATVGDTVHWRVLNASTEVHPMHLHGFYFRVDTIVAGGLLADGQTAPDRRVVTERMPQLSAMSITWVPERAGNWLFHCHFQEHVMPHGALNGVGPNGEPQRIGVRPLPRAGESHANHALTGMAGLAVGIAVRLRAGTATPRPEPERRRRRLRLVAVQDTGFDESQPSMRFVLVDPVTRRRTESRPGISPTLELTRGQPVAITVVNHLREPTTVHWHGIELESYFDGVAGYSGSRHRLAPAIAPGDSFEARFTPPRAGTFIYHSHMTETRHHRAGLVGALIVRDVIHPDSSEELIVVIKSARAAPRPDSLVPFRFDAASVEINGDVDPDTTVLRVGRRYRMRFIGLQVAVPNATVWLTARPDSVFANPRDSMLVQWRPVAKDGADLPAAARAPRLARQLVSMGETYDFEFVPERRGNLRLEVRAPVARDALLTRVPIRVE